MTELRIDRWLWFTRFYKSRSAAAKAVTGGHVRLNGERARGANRVREGDRIELVKEQLTWRFSVTAIPGRRGPAAEARACYAEDPAAVAAREERQAGLRRDRLQMPQTDGRPDKHTRRKLRDRNREY
ncbi:MAG: RNA-binding S4 domain-containing protein [Pseudomonadota bacterium]